MRKFLALIVLVLGSVATYAAQTITGTVLNASDGEPIIGASIVVEGSTTGTITDTDGKFSLSVESGDKVTVSFLGMEPQTLLATDGMVVRLSEDAQVLDEVMVIGYGTEKKSSFTGSASEVKASDINMHVTSSATNALVGKVAGLQAVSSSGAPGSSPTLTIRGIGSYSASSAPLYIIDGVPMEQSMSSVNPNDIESISVLKDASASAIYGNRGANGVIIITTKKAKGLAKDAEITVDAKWGSNSRLLPRYDVITDPGQYYETHYRAMYNSKAYNGSSAADAYAFADANLYNANNGGLGYQVFTVPDGEKLIGTNFKLNPHATLGYSDGTYTYLPDNWYDEVIGSAFRQEYNVSASGNTGRLTYFASVGYLSDGGQVEKSKFERYTARTNVDYQAKKWLKLTTNMAYTHYVSQTPSYGSTYGSSTNMFYYANSMGAIYPLYVRDAAGNIMKENGRIVYDANQTKFTRPNFGDNAVRANAYNDYRAFGDLFFGQWGAVITPIEGLNLTANISANAINSRDRSLYSRFGSGSTTDGAAAVEHERVFTTNQQYLASYTRTFVDQHNMSILVGYEQYKAKEQALSAYNTHLYNPFVGEINNAEGPKADMSMESYTDNYMTAGVLARLNYNFAERYFLNASIRRDASSKFAPGHRWGTFWSVGAAWQINKENFMSSISWIDLLKLKLSYGENGNDQGMGWHAYSDRYAATYNSTTKEYSLEMSAKGNDNLTWETKKSWNVGVDFEMFKNRLNGTIEFYTGTTSDLLWSKTVPLSSGLMVSSYPANVGSLQNTGVDITLDGTVFKNQNIDWSVNVVLAHNKNKFTELDVTIKDKGLRYSNSIVRVGGSRYQAYMVKYAGVDKSNGRAQYWKAYTWEKSEANMAKPEAERELVAMTNTYGEGPIVKEELTYDITAASRYDLGDVLPKLNGGFGTSLKAYGADLSLQFSYQLGGKFYDGAYQQLMHNGQEIGHAMHKDLLKAWSPENPDSDIPRLSTAAIDDPGVASQTTYDRFLTSSNYLCLNNLTVGYTFPKKWMSKLTINNFRIYFAGENLFLLTKRQGMDPRYNYGIGSMTSGGGLASGSYAAMRTFTGGLTVTF